MNNQKYLILIKGEDKTEQILRYENDKYYIYVYYKDAEKKYTYTRNDFESYKNPIEIDIQKHKVFLNYGYTYNIVQVLKFDRYYRIFFENNSSIVVPENDVDIIQNDDKIVVSPNKFEYFKDISKIVSVRTEEGIELLTKEYEKINFIEKDTALYRYLTPSDKTTNLTSSSANQLIFPFGANKSQFNAVKNAMSNQISIIEGPPRNGKNSDNLEYYCKYY